MRPDTQDTPQRAIPALSVCIYDSFGYHVRFKTGRIELPGDMLDLGNQIASAINDAYEQGRIDQAATIREARAYGDDT